MDSTPPSQPFSLDATSGDARAGTLRLVRGMVQTPVFMPVGTQATVKSLDRDDLRGIGASIVLANTYHLMLRPGADTIERLGGVSHFMRWEGPVLTDSGGFQVFSLAGQRRINDDGVVFRSHLDGSAHELTPERAVELQVQFGSDVIMALDVCSGYDATEQQQRDAARLTHAWLPRNIARMQQAREERNSPALLFGIAQGGFSAADRTTSAHMIAASAVDGCAIGGLSVGEPKPVMAEMLDASVRGLPADKPRYLMGVGSPEDLWNGVAQGVDMFDCVHPTRVARRGGLFTPDGRVNITAAQHRESDTPIIEGCRCLACTVYGRAYLHHLFRARETLSYRLASLHNLTFMQDLMAGIRASIIDGTFATQRATFLARYQPADQEAASAQREVVRKRKTVAVSSTASSRRG